MLSQRNIILSVFIMFMVSCIKEENTRETAGALAPFDPNNTPVRWTSSALSGGLNVKISTDLMTGFTDDANGRNPVEQMMHEWNESTTSFTFFQTDAATTTNKDYSSLSSYKSDGELGIYRSNSWNSSLSTSALAITQYFGFRRNAGTASEYVEINHADIIFNYDHYNFTLDQSDTSLFDFKTVILHELGHFIGLTHASTSSTGAVMLPSLTRSEVKNSLTSFDTDNIRALYGVSSLSVKSMSSSIIKSNSVSQDGPRTTSEQEGEEVTGIIELRESGDCHHYLNDKLISTHKVNIRNE